MTRFNDMKPPDDIVRLLIDLKAAFVNPGKLQHPMSNVFRWASVRGSDGYVEVGEHFVDSARDLRASRHQTSLLIKDLLSAMCEFSCSPIFREKDVSHATPFVNVLVREAPYMLLEWVEDMVTNDREHGLIPQPIAMITGTLFAPTFNQQDAATVGTYRSEPALDRSGRALSFWDQAVESKHFPIEIFSTPCAWDEGEVFSSNRVMVLASIFSVVSDLAVRKFGGHLRVHTTMKNVRPLVNPETNEKYPTVVPVLSNDISIVFRDIVTQIKSSLERKALVASVLGVVSK